MNCREFTTIVSDLASASLMDAARRSDGQEHADGCRLCAARLADELVLVGGLKMLSNTDIDSTPAPSAAAEASLRDAFRQFQVEKIQTGKTMAAPSPMADPGRHRGLLLVAAALFALIGGSLLAATVWPDRVDERLQAAGDQPVKSAEPSPTATQVLRRDPASDQVSPQGQPRVAVRRPTGKRGMITPVGGIRGNSIDTSEITVSIGAFSPMSNEAEVATEFIPLLLGSDLPPVESGQVIRVQMPRSALASFGLPFNVERADESVKADVLVGDDGLARAVRFVR